MPESRPNVVLLIVDALRYDRIGACGHAPAVTPNLDVLVGDGMSASHLFANGCVTQAAFPSIFTSTLPLDWGGYNGGIRHRPDSVAEAFRAAGYETWAAITGHPCSSHFGYARGFDHFEDLIDLYQWFRSIFKTMLRELLDGWQAGRLDDATMFATLAAEYGHCLDDTIRYIDQMEQLRLPANGWDRRSVRERVLRERELLQRDPQAICAKLVELDQDYRYALGVAHIDSSLRRSIARRRRRHRRLNRRVMLASERRAFSARVVNGRFEHFLRERDRSKPFFAVVHFFDVHEAKLLASNWSIRNVVDVAASAARVLPGRARGQGGTLYDLGVHIVDVQVGRLRKLLERAGLDDNTLLAMTGDHGAIAGAPVRAGLGRASDMSRMFFDEFLHVPFTLAGPGIGPGAWTRLSSHLDLAPTMLDAAGLAVPSSFKGRSLLETSTDTSGSVLSENTGNGRCDIDAKTIHIGLRGKRIKTVYSADGFHPVEREVYDLERDAEERENLLDSQAFAPEREQHLALVRERLAELQKSVVEHGACDLLNSIPAQKKTTPAVPAAKV